MALRRGVTRLPQGTVIHTHRYRDAMLTLMARKAGRKERHLRGQHAPHRPPRTRLVALPADVPQPRRPDIRLRGRARTVPLHVEAEKPAVPARTPPRRSTTASTSLSPEPSPNRKGAGHSRVPRAAAPREGTGDADRRPPQAQRGANAPADSRHRASRLHRRPQEPRPGPRSYGDDRLAQAYARPTPADT